jgi:hypothetical protein
MLLVAAALILVGTISKNWITGGRGENAVHIGPMGAEVCMESRCIDVPSRGMDGDIEAIMVLAMISGFASAAAAGTFGGMAFAGKSSQIPIPPKLAQIAFGLAAFSMTFFVIRMLSEKGEISWAGFPAIGGVILAGVGLKKLMPFLGQRALPAGQPQYPNQSQPMNPYANQSQPMQPYPNQTQPQHGSQPYQQQPQYGSQPYQQPMQAQPQYGSQPHQQPMQQPHAAPQQPQAIPNCPRCGAPLQFVAQYQRWFCAREQQYV